MHDCVNCGCACYCHGDIDDCAVETAEYAYDHCEGCGCASEPDSGWPDEADGCGLVEVTCPSCNGTGEVGPVRHPGTRCGTCGGGGAIRVSP